MAIFFLGLIDSVVSFVLSVTLEDYLDFVRFSLVAAVSLTIMGYMGWRHDKETENETEEERLERMLW